jgi:Homeodomain-like domain
MPNTIERRATRRRAIWAGLGDHGFAYLDSFGDTGATPVPILQRTRGSTGTWGDPRWEALDLDDRFCIFAIGEGRIVSGGGLIFEIPSEIGSTLIPPSSGRDVVYVTPWRTKLSTAEQPDRKTVAAAALEEVLRNLRAQAALPVGELAAMLGVSRRQFYNWLQRANEPDLEQEARVRHTAKLVAQLHDAYGESRLVRAALLTPTPAGSAYEALRANDMTAAEAAVTGMVLGLQAPTIVQARVSNDRDRILEQLAHLRDAPRQEDRPE